MTAHCFERVLTTYLDDGHLLNPDAAICHGLPVGTGPENRGVRYWHAWIDTGYGFVIAPVGDEMRAVASATFCALGRLDAHGEGQLVWRFDADAIWAEMRARGHHGPWVDGYEGMGL